MQNGARPANTRPLDGREGELAGTESLAQRLRNETRDLHTEVERSTLMHALLRGELGLRPYCMLLRNLHAIYRALEAALTRNARQPLLAPIFASALFRSAALEQDLDSLHGPLWNQAIALQPASLLYVARLRELDRTSSDLLVAHSYVRYLGDLSGGQLLKRIVATSFQLTGSAGTAFYDFGDTDQTRALTHQFRAGLTNMGADQAQTSAIVTEARQAFEWHRDLFKQLALASGLDAP